jgi:hypothetical protein
MKTPGQFVHGPKSPISPAANASFARSVRRVTPPSGASKPRCCELAVERGDRDLRVGHSDAGHRHQPERWARELFDCRRDVEWLFGDCNDVHFGLFLMVVR